MILGLDHLALGVPDTDAARAALEARGYTLAFIEREAPNDPAKRGLLEHYQPSHDLALFHAPPGSGEPTIEITNHGPRLRGPEGPYIYSEGAIRLRVPRGQGEAERRFFRDGLQFGESAEGAGELRLTRPVPRWSCRLVIEEGAEAAPALSTLDAPGHACLALLTNDLRRDTERALASGAREVTPFFNSRVNERRLAIVLFRSPAGAICELIEIQGPGSS